MTLLADLVVLTHFGFIGFVLFGGLLSLRWRGWLWIHLPAVLWGASVEIFGWVCPLTPLEFWLRDGGSGAYTGGFVEHYLLPILYPQELNRELQLLLGSGVIITNLLVYLLVWRRRSAR